MRHMVVDVSDHLLPVSVNPARASEGQLPLHSRQTPDPIELRGFTALLSKSSIYTEVPQSPQVVLEPQPQSPPTMAKISDLKPRLENTFCT